MTDITIASPTHAEAKTLTQEDVWGKYVDHIIRLHTGMVVAEGHNDRFPPNHGSKTNICPVKGDTVPWKSVTVIGPLRYVEEISYWLEYVHGCDCIEWVEELTIPKTDYGYVRYEPMVAIRSNYTCW